MMWIGGEHQIAQVSQLWTPGHLMTTLGVDSWTLTLSTQASWAFHLVDCIIPKSLIILCVRNQTMNHSSARVAVAIVSSRSETDLSLRSSAINAACEVQTRGKQNRHAKC